ncbi:MAG: hypothetical protein GY847_38840 [Proteobacteria bacterium]|nr:hypothetical protein [Pseudomonadota bacterium]
MIIYNTAENSIQMYFVLSIVISILVINCSGDDNKDDNLPIGADSDSDADGDTDSDTDTDTDSDSDSDSDSDYDTENDAGYENIGICGTEGTGIVTADTFQGTEERYLIDDNDEDICRVRYELSVVGEPRTDCELCDWAFDLEISDKIEMVAEAESGCEMSSLELDEEAISAMIGRRISYGYVDEYMGHSSVIMQYGDSGQWEAVTFASWNSESGELSYDRKDGNCGY